MDEKLKEKLKAAGWTTGSASDFLNSIMTYQLPRPGDPDWDDKNLEGSPYQCSICKGKTKHNEKYDAYYCETCNTWNDLACSDPECEFCANRPEKPL